MATLGLEEYAGSFEEMFTFPSSPDQLAVFSSDSSSDDDLDASDYFGVYDQKDHVNKMTATSHHRHQRQAALSAVPSLEAMNKKQLVVPDFIDFNKKTFDVDTPSLNSSSTACPPPSVHPSSLSSPSRIKTTTPNIALLFSLFDVLEEDGDDSSSSFSSSPSPASSSPSPFMSASSAPSSPSSSSRRQSLDAMAARVPEQGLRSHYLVPDVVCTDRASLLSSLADL